MSRRVRDVDVRDLAAIPAPCGACVFWQRGSVAERTSDLPAKEAWWQATQLEWGMPGKALVEDGRVVALAVFGPGEHFPRSRRLGASVSDDAVLLASLWVAEDHRSHGYAKQLVQAVLREVTRHGARALEAYGTRGAGADQGCVLPEPFLLEQGFAVLHEHTAYPLLRLDLRSTARWAESVGQALEGVRSVLLRRERAPAPARVQGAR